MLDKIIIHWTAGSPIPCAEDKQHYHFLFDSLGNLYKGNFKPEDNIDCKDGKYAQHTGGGNTGAIGVSMCGMYGFKNFKNPGKVLITEKQLQSCLSYVATLCIKYHILPENIMTHYEFGKAHPDSESFGKIDIIYLPSHAELKVTEIGNWIRNKVYWYIQKQLRTKRK